MEPKPSVKTAAKTRVFVLPPQVVGRTDISRLLRELEILESALVGSQALKNTSPETTSLLGQIAAANGYQLSEKNNRQHLAGQLTKIRDHAPTVHISFAAEPSPQVTETILGWLRANIHAYMLLQIGLQPSIAAGCIVRTPNKIFDLSLRAHFEKQKPYLVELIKNAAAGATR